MVGPEPERCGEGVVQDADRLHHAARGCGGRRARLQGASRGVAGCSVRLQAAVAGGSPA